MVWRVAEPYKDFIDRRRRNAPDQGIRVSDAEIHPALYPFQRHVVRWALRKGRAALFEDCGLGKTIQQLEWARFITSHTGLPVLVFAPLAVGRQTAREGAKIDLPVHVVREQADVTAGACVTNYEMLHHFDPTAFGGLVLDECFAPGTLVDVVGESGIYQKHIENIRPGDVVWNAIGADMVSEVHRREVPYAVKVKAGNSIFVSSPNHPIFTQRGWQRACCLYPGDYALGTAAAVRLVRAGICPEGAGLTRTKVLRSVLLSELADESTGALGEGAQPNRGGEARGEEGGMVSGGIAGSDTRTGAGAQPESDERSQVAGESVSYVEGHEAQAFRAWGQWDWADGAAGVHAGCAWRRLDSGICVVAGPTNTGLSDALQAGFGRTEQANRDRGGWELPLRAAGPGHQEGVQGGFVRVDCIEILEPGHPELEGLRHADGKLYFYDLGATRHPSYSVAGILVHNSSILKDHLGKLRGDLIEFAAQVPFRLAATATPAPNDLTELVNHASYLGIMSHMEALALWFTQDGNSTQKWRLKKHAERDWWQWVGTWAVAIRSPGDIGFEGTGFDLPELRRHVHVIDDESAPDGEMFAIATTLHEQRRARRDTLAERCGQVAEMVNDSTESWVVWCELNDESTMLAKLIPDAVEVRGSDDRLTKFTRLDGFSEGKVRVLITKPSIAGHGLNWQHCAKVAFVGLSHSYEQFYQAIRRVWRYGQRRPVDVHVVSNASCVTVLDNVQRKEEAAMQLYDSIIHQMRPGTAPVVSPEHDEKASDEWRLMLGDSVETVDRIDDHSVGLSVFSPPFPGMYVYTDSPHDMGNVSAIDEMIEQFAYLMAHGKMQRVMLPGRSVFIHITQGVAQQGRDGYIGLRDFRGPIIEMMQRNGWIYYGEVTIDKNPQVKAVRTKDSGLTFKSLATDAARMHPALSDMLLQFRAPGKNQMPIRAGRSERYGNTAGWVTPEDWILWARPVWYASDYEPGSGGLSCETGIAETNVLNVAAARSEQDERHLCPLQLGVIRRCVRVWSNPGDLVYSPFAGVGSEGVVALSEGRRFVGGELKRSYFDVAATNLRETAAQGTFTFDE